MVDFGKRALYGIQDVDHVIRAPAVRSVGCVVVMRGLNVMVMAVVAGMVHVTFIWGYGVTIAAVAVGRGLDRATSLVVVTVVAVVIVVVVAVGVIVQFEVEVARVTLLAHEVGSGS